MLHAPHGFAHVKRALAYACSKSYKLLMLTHIHIIPHPPTSDWGPWTQGPWPNPGWVGGGLSEYEQVFAIYTIFCMHKQLRAELVQDHVDMEHSGSLQ